MNVLFMTKISAALRLLASCLVYALIAMLVTLVVVVVFTRELEQILLWLTYALLVEGGLALVIGGSVASFSSTFGKIEAVVFRSEPWDAKRLREAERTARVWIVTGLFLFLFGLLVSSVL